jgi:hypothetical protein
MRRFATLTLAALLALAPALTRAQPAAQPHAWLFGSWTGGLFPAPSGLTAQQCLMQPVVIFTRDLVLRATLTDVVYVQRIVATARAAKNGTEFRFEPVPAPSPGTNLLGLTPAPIGFGCADPDELDVQRISENQISFPNCRDFPYPLVRCPGR